MPHIATVVREIDSARAAIVRIDDTRRRTHIAVITNGEAISTGPPTTTIGISH
jgi:hypothetical protein